MNDFFRKYKKSDIDAHILLRTGETKLGELVVAPAEESLPLFLESTTALFVIVGIAEDIGVVANYGKAGASATWNLFLRSFLNMQANHFTKAESIAIIGHFSFDKIKEEIEAKSGVLSQKNI